MRYKLARTDFPTRRFVRHVMSNLPATVAESKGLDARYIYVVDDELMIGEVVQVILRLEGFKPKFFADPEKALQSFLEEETKPALLLTDYLMSPINGMELIDRCKKHHPDLKT